MHYLFGPFAIIVLFYIYFVKEKENVLSKFGVLLMAVFIVLLFGWVVVLQPIHGDPRSYARTFEYISHLNMSEMWALERPEVSYKLLNWGLSALTDDYRVLFLVLFTVFIYFTMKALKLIYNQHERFGLMLVLVTYPFFMTYVVNGKRHGLALVFMLYAIILLQKNKKVSGLLALAFSITWHNSMLLGAPVILLFLMLNYFNRMRIVIVIYVASIIVSMTSLSGVIVEKIISVFFADSYYSGYATLTAMGWGYKVGFRADFFVFSIIPLALYYYYKNQIKEEIKERVQGWVSLYMLLNSLYHLASGVVFSDRFAAYSWYILPIVCFEVLRGVSRKKADFVLMGFLVFDVMLIQFYTGAMFHPLGLF